MRLDDKKETGTEQEVTEGCCPVCGQRVIWTPTSQLWPSKRLAKSAMPCFSGTCSGCKRVLMFTVVSDQSDVSKASK